jgi:hypothetical protein
MALLLAQFSALSDACGATSCHAVSDSDVRDWGRVMVINNDFEFGYLLIAFAFLGVILLGSLLAALHLDGWHPKLIGAVVGALLGVALIEAVPMFT